MLLEATLAAATGVDLRLDDDDGVAGRLEQLVGGGARLVRAEDDARERDGHAERAQQLLALVFVDLHVAGCSFLP